MAGPNVKGMVSDPDFQGLSPADKRSALFKLTGDSSFNGLSDAETMQFVQRMGAQAAPQKTVATGTISAMPKGVGPWLQNLEGDLRQGTGFTLPGRLLQKLGAPGLENGTTPAVANEIASPILGPVKMAQGAAQLSSKPLQGAGKILSGGLQTAELPLAFMGNAPGAAESVMGKTIPGVMKEQAGQKFSEVAGAANKVPVAIENASDAAMKLMDWQKKTVLGPTINKFLNRITSPSKGPMTYEEARDFYSLLTKMSSDEYSKLAPVVQRDLNALVKGLSADIGNAAGQVGKAAQYHDAMTQFAKGASRGRFVGKVAKIFTASAVSGAGAGAGYDIYKMLTK